MLSRSSRLMAAAAISCLGLASARAQTAKPPAPGATGAQGQQQGPMKVDLISTGSDWVKVCGQDQGNQKKICYTTLNVVFKNSMNNEVTFTIPLSGFGKAFDGPPIDPKELERKQQQVQQELQQKLEERAKAQRQQLEQQGGAATPAPAAATTPAAPAK